MNLKVLQNMGQLSLYSGPSDFQNLPAKTILKKQHILLREDIFFLQGIKFESLQKRIKPALLCCCDRINDKLLSSDSISSINHFFVFISVSKHRMKKKWNRIEEEEFDSIRGSFSFEGLFFLSVIAGVLKMAGVVREALAASWGVKDSGVLCILVFSLLSYIKFLRIFYWHLIYMVNSIKSLWFWYTK